LFNVGKPSSEMLELATIVKELAAQISDYFSELRHLKKARTILERGSIDKHQDKAEEIYDNAVSGLFRTDNSLKFYAQKKYMIIFSGQ